MNTTPTRTPNIRVERIQGRLRVMEAVGRRIVRDEFHELLRIEEQLKQMLRERANEDKKLISNLVTKLDAQINHP